MAKTEKTLEQLQEEMIAAQKAYEEAQKVVEQRKAEEAAAKKRELESKREARFKEIQEKHEELYSLIKEYCKDYGSLKLSMGDTDDKWFSPFWRRHIFF